MSKKRRHKRCPHCNSLSTQRYGYKPRKKFSLYHPRIRCTRWYCRNCNRTFSNLKSIYSFTYAKRAAELYFDGKSSYRNAAKLLRIDRMTAYKHIQAVCKRAKMPYELSMELKPTWSGYLALDSDDINVFRHKEHLLIAVDVGTLDIPNALLCKHQGQLDWELLLETLKQLHYPFKAIISDGAFTLLSAVKRSLPNIPHQVCVRHFEDESYRFLRYRKHRMPVDPKLTELFMKYLHDVLYAPTNERYLCELHNLISIQHPDLKPVTTRLQHHYKYLTPHLFDANIPRTTNVIENIISQLDLKLNPIIKFGSHESAWNTLKLVISWYRFKKFSSCNKKNQRNNGKSPLEIAGVTPKNTHWIYHAIRQNLPTNF